MRLCLLCIVKKIRLDSNKTEEEIVLEVCAYMAIPALAMLQQHDARRDILIEPVARRRAAIEARGIRNWGRNRAVKTHRLVCVTLTGTSTLQR